MSEAGTTPRITGAYRHLLFLPRTPARAFPLILFLHGVHERGDDLDLVRRHGPLRTAAKSTGFPFAVVAPQCPSGQYWSPPRLGVLLDQVLAEHPLDPDRVYLTGLSMGGHAAWSLAVDQPHRFAAVAPICGHGDPRRAGRMRRLPIWAFHGEADPVVPLAASRAMVDAVRRCGGEARLTVYRGAGHDAWTRAYRDADLYGWFLAHRRRRTRMELTVRERHQPPGG